MARFRTHSAKEKLAPRSTGIHFIEQKPKSRRLDLVPSNNNISPEMDNDPVPPFMAWPSYLFERMATPLHTVTSAISWMDSWRVGNRLTVPKSASRRTDTEYMYTVELPGITSEQISLGIQNGLILLRVSENEDTLGKKYNSRTHVIRRAFTLPVYTNADAITAKLRDSVLTITIPKANHPVAAKSRLIEITQPDAPE